MIKNFEIGRRIAPSRLCANMLPVPQLLLIMSSLWCVATVADDIASIGELGQKNTFGRYPSCLTLNRLSKSEAVPFSKQDVQLSLK